MLKTALKLGLEILWLWIKIYAHYGIVRVLFGYTGDSVGSVSNMYSITCITIKFWSINYHNVTVQIHVKYLCYFLTNWLIFCCEVKLFMLDIAYKHFRMKGLTLLCKSGVACQALTRKKILIVIKAYLENNFQVI